MDPHYFSQEQTLGPLERGDKKCSRRRGNEQMIGQRKGARSVRARRAVNHKSAARWTRNMTECDITAS